MFNTLLGQILYDIASFEVDNECKALRVHLTTEQVQIIQREQGLNPTQFYNEIGDAVVRVSDVFCIVGVG